MQIRRATLYNRIRLGRFPYPYGDSDDGVRLAMGGENLHGRIPARGAIRQNLPTITPDWANPAWLWAESTLEI